MAALKLEEALLDLAAAVNASGNRDARMRAARQVLVSRCVAALELELPRQPSIGDIAKLGLRSRSASGRRTCAVLMVHGLAVPGLVPPAAASHICALVETALPTVLMRCGYPFGGSTEEKLRVLARLQGSLSELMQPLEPTFPNWQGLYAG